MFTLFLNRFWWTNTLKNSFCTNFFPTNSFRTNSPLPYFTWWRERKLATFLHTIIWTIIWTWSDGVVMTIITKKRERHEIEAILENTQTETPTISRKLLFIWYSKLFCFKFQFNCYLKLVTVKKVMLVLINSRIEKNDSFHLTT